ncbi:MAG: cell division protein SepF [Acidimicrobiales bacterium]|nr:cell division protein SepF [Acidimicrobiales bacterium]
MWRKAMIHLGLGDDADYDQYPVDDREPDVDHEGEGGPHPPQQRRPAPPVQPAPVSAYPEEPSAIGEVRPINTRGTLASRETAMGPGQTVNPTGQGGIRPRPQVVRPVPMTANAKPHVVVPASFNQAQDVADKFKSNQPVVMNLQAADRELSRRLIDFASGLCYGLGGQMERLVNQVYLLTPSNVDVSADERRRLEERGYES